MTEADNGFLIVASVTAEYVRAAELAGASIKDFYPEAHVTLVVPKKLCTPDLYNTFDHIICEDVPDHSRTKLWALSRTPYSNLTVYLDADMQCVHEDITTIWDEMPDTSDILITRIRGYNGKIHKWANGEMIHHGGFFMYRNTPPVIDFMDRWDKDYVKQRSEPWPYSDSEHPVALQQWDQFTFWKMLNIDKSPVRVKFFEDDARWNFVNGYFLNENVKPIIFYHHTIPTRVERN